MQKRYIVNFLSKVQRVGFRRFVKIMVDELNIKGWVRNNDDGSVILVVEGKKNVLDKLVGNIKIKYIEAKIRKIIKRENHIQGILMIL